LQHRKRAMLRQTVPCSEQQQLGLVSIELKTVVLRQQRLADIH